MKSFGKVGENFGKVGENLGKVPENFVKGLTKLNPLTVLPGMPTWNDMTGSHEEDAGGDGSTSTEDKPRGANKFRMRNIFAAPLEFTKESLEGVWKAAAITKSGEQTEFLQAAFAEHFVFANMSSRESKFLISMMALKKCHKGETIIEQGQRGEYLYVLQEGAVQFVIDGVAREQLGEKGTVFGELSLLYDCPTAASVIAHSDCHLWRVSQLTFRRIKAAHALEGDKEKRDVITSVSFFKGLSNDLIYKLADSLFERKFKKDEILVIKGSEANTMFMVKEGWIRATDISTKETKLADIKMQPGDHFGERAMVKGTPYAGTAVALTDGSAWCLSKKHYKRALGNLDLEQSIVRAQDFKMLQALPLFAYSDIDRVETELLAENIVDCQHAKGHVFANQGQKVDPALYIIRKGSVNMTKKSGENVTLSMGESFGFGGATLILTNKLMQESPEGVQAWLHQKKLFSCQKAINDNSVGADYTAIATEDVTVGMITLKQITKILYDPLRVGRRVGATPKSNINMQQLERRKVLGAGTFGTVWLTRHPATDTPYALKVQYKRQLIDFNQAKGVIREEKIMSRMHHPFVMSIVSSQQDEQCLYMVMDLLQGGELGSVMHTRKRKHLAEGSARFYGAGVLEGLSYMHRRFYIYRDLKGENVLLDNDGYAVIVDLGFAKFVPDKTFTFCGTPLFIAPEIVLSKGHDKGADIWSYGVLLYEMMTGENPFYTNEDMDQVDLFKAIVKGKYSYPHDSKISDAAKDLIDKILVGDPKVRLGSRNDLEIRNHAWFEGFDFGALYRKELTPVWTPKIKNPFDGSNFGDWSDAEKEEKDFQPLSHEEQQLFADFGQ
ncbi:MAP kinase-activated protein kinase 2 (Fragment) [Seminavis robusta]|uniref:cGMP-dependent protein kinase n=1 Tax=Seminavis robusta TaxID=568900 RepID=A0A9N8EFG9_9STRA